MKYYREHEEMKLVRGFAPHTFEWKKVIVRTVWEKPMLEDGGTPEHGTVFYTNAWWSWRSVRKVPVRFRFDPVPGIHNSSRRNFGCWYKKPKTTNERRQYYAYGPEYVRGSRRDHNLPNSWDDYPRSDAKSHSWKNVKKEKQWQKRK